MCKVLELENKGVSAQEVALKDLKIIEDKKFKFSEGLCQFTSHWIILVTTKGYRSSASGRSELKIYLCSKEPSLKLLGLHGCSLNGRQSLFQVDPLYTELVFTTLELDFDACEEENLLSLHFF